MIDYRLGRGLLVVLLLTALSSDASAGYNIVSLGVIPGGSLSIGAAINAGGEAVGSAETPGGTMNAFRSNGGSATSLMTLPGGRFSAARAINPSGVVVGESEIQVAPGIWRTHAFRMEPGGSMQDLGVPTNALDSFATGINAGGLISGYAVMGSGLSRGFVSAGPGDFGFLETFRIDGNSFALGLNDAGQVVGAADVSPGIYRAFVTTAGSPLVPLGLPVGPGGSSFATAINNAGRIAGYYGETGSFRAFRTRPDGSIEDLGMLTGAQSMIANAINGLGDVVGSASVGGGASRAFLYNDLDGLIDLNKLLDPGSGWVLTSATGINDQGQITGTGRFQGQTLAFRLDPVRNVVPEPGSVVLAAIGVGLGTVLLRRGGRLRSGRTAGRGAA